MERLVAIDWGTSSLRGALVDAHSDVLDERRVERGISSVAPGEFPAVLQAHFGDWLQMRGTLCLIAGMAGSRQGWVEAPYCACPASLADVAAALRWVEPGRIAIVPGLVCEDAGVPDVMRGEETQIFGALRRLECESGVFVLPGTHSKWARVDGQRVQSFETVMTGEFYALLRRHSILARSVAADADDDALDGDAFDRGVVHAQRGTSLMRTAFSARSLALFERLAGHAVPSYLSGLVIGEELRSQSLAAIDSVVVIGAEALTERYQRALASCGVAARRLGSEASWLGLHSVAAALERAEPR